MSLIFAELFQILVVFVARGVEGSRFGKVPLGKVRKAFPVGSFDNRVGTLQTTNFKLK